MSTVYPQQERVSADVIKPSEQLRGNRFAAFLVSRRFKFIVTLLIVLALIVFIPYMFWLWAPELDLSVAVVDKTVAFKSRREHRGFFWLLGQNKFIDRQAAKDERFYDWTKDYIGYQPEGMPKQEGHGTKITPEALKDRDVLIMADTYGVYWGDYKQFPNQDIAATARSPIIYGGLEEAEVAAIEQFAAQGKLVIGEFNTFASPTPPELRARMEKLFGVKWTGWMGRFFLDFQDVKDVPAWFIERYKQTYGAKWDLYGSGFILVNNESQEFFILQDLTDVGTEALTINPVDKYTGDDVMHGAEATRFNFWFDIVEAQPGTEVLAKYNFDLRSMGAQKMKANNLPLSFPAIIRKQDPACRAYYLAGDMVDFNKAMGHPHTRWTLYIDRSYYRRPAPGGQGTFFWLTYYPMLSNILRLECQKLTGQPERAFLFDPPKFERRGTALNQVLP